MKSMNLVKIISLYLGFNLLIIGEVSSSSSNIGQDIRTGIEIVDNIDEFLLKNPQSEKFTEMKKEISSDRMRSERDIIRYTIGYQNPNDLRLVEGSDTFYYPTLQDVQLQLSYPKAGVGGIVNFVEILVDQNSNIGRAYIVAGGIGQRFIRILVEAKHVSYFSYRAAVFGYY